MTPLTFFRLSLFLPFLMPLGDIPPGGFGALLYVAFKYSLIPYALTIPLLWWMLGKCRHLRDFRRLVLLTPLLCGGLASSLGAIAVVLGCRFGLLDRWPMWCANVSATLWGGLFFAGVAVCFAYLFALIILVASFPAVWLRIVKPPVAA